MHRYVHYEAAFEDYLRSRGIPYVPVDETRKVIFSGAKVKSFDFLVYPKNAAPWIVDVKGRRFPYVHRSGNEHYWENWVTQEDLDSLSSWQSVFPAEFEAVFVFAYLLEGRPERWPTTRPHVFRGEHYAFFTMTRLQYEQCCRLRSPKWETVCVPRRRFREMIRPLEAECTTPTSAA